MCPSCIFEVCTASQRVLSTGVLPLHSFLSFCFVFQVMLNILQTNVVECQHGWMRVHITLLLLKDGVCTVKILCYQMIQIHTKIICCKNMAWLNGRLVKAHLRNAFVNWLRFAVIYI